MEKTQTHTKSRIIGILAGLASLTLAATAFAATTASFSPATLTVTEGQNVSLVISLDPQGAKIYTGKIEMTFPGDLLEAASFSFGAGLTPLSQPGYDLVDNKNGILAKTAGYPGGVSVKATFGTVSFKAKKSGTGVVRITTNSLALDADNKNTMSGLPVNASVTVVGALPAPSPAPSTSPSPVPASTQKPAAMTVKGTVEPQPVPTPTTEVVVPVAQEESVAKSAAASESGGGLAAAVADAFDTKTIGLIVVALIAGAGGSWFLMKRKEA